MAGGNAKGNTSLTAIGEARATVALAMGTELWINWAEIALEHRDEAQTARATAEGPGTGNPELQAAMVAIVAAASAIDGFATRVRDAGVRPALKAPRPSRAIVVWETLRSGFDVGSKTSTWPIALKELWALRSSQTDGGLVHPRTEFGKPVTMPGDDTPILSPARLTYTAARASWATGLMCEIFERCDARSTRDEFEALASLVHGFASYVAAFSKRDAAASTRSRSSAGDGLSPTTTSART